MPAPENQTLCALYIDLDKPDLGAINSCLVNQGIKRGRPDRNCILLRRMIHEVAYALITRRGEIEKRFALSIGGRNTGNFYVGKSGLKTPGQVGAGFYSKHTTPVPNQLPGERRVVAAVGANVDEGIARPQGLFDYAGVSGFPHPKDVKEPEDEVVRSPRTICPPGSCTASERPLCRRL